MASRAETLDKPLTFRPVTKRTWPAFEALFETPSAPKYCWCMAWRPMEHDRTSSDSAVRKAEMKRTIWGSAAPVGLLAYRGREAIGWVSIAPRETYTRLGGPEAQPGERVWSLVCMFIRRAYRGQGLADQLIAGAVAHARKSGATVIEAYPVAPDSPSYRFGGFIPAFARAGFAEVAKAGTRRHVMRLTA